MDPIYQTQAESTAEIPLYTEQIVTTTSSLPTVEQPFDFQHDQQPLLSDSTSYAHPSTFDIPILPQVPLQQRYLSYAPVETVTQSRKPRVKRPNPVIFDDKSVTSGGGYETASNPSQSNHGAATKVPKKRGPKPGSHHHSSGGSATSSGIGYHASKRPRGRPPLAIKKEPAPHSFLSMPPPSTASRSLDVYSGVPSYSYYSLSAAAPTLPSSARQPRPPWAVLLHRLLSLLAGQGPLSLLDLGRRLPGVPRDMLQGALEFLLTTGIAEGHRVKAPEGTLSFNGTTPSATINSSFLPAGGTAVYALTKNAARGPTLLFPPEITFEEGQATCHNQELAFFLQRLACQGAGHAAELEELERTKARLERLQQLERELMSMSGRRDRVRHLSNEIRALVDKEPQLAQESLYRAVLVVLPPAV